VQGLTRRFSSFFVVSGRRAALRCLEVVVAAAKTLRGRVLYTRPSMSDAALRLLRWYRRHRRALPWREDSSPYRVLVSELMLQQTRVETVLRYYEPFLRRFPTISALAAADVDAVLSAWTGLGYYRRARNLHAAAREIERRGSFPRTAAELLDLPGIGAYTAAAVASIAFGETVAVVDGNVERVAARLAALDDDPKRGNGAKRVREIAAGLIVDGAAGDGNQAMMELGATVCTPRSPRCDACPLTPECRALAAGAVERYPRGRRAAPPTRVRRTVAFVEGAAGVLLVRVPGDASQLAGLWELPWSDSVGDEAVEGSLGERYGGRWTLGASLGGLRHSVTSRRYEIDVRRARYRGGSGVAESEESAWVPVSRVPELPSTAVVGKVLRLVAAASSE